MPNRRFSMIGKISIIPFAGLLASLALASCSADGAAQSAAKLSSASECTAGESLAPSEAGLEVRTLCIDIKNDGATESTQRFEVEMAITNAQQSKGLMFRTELADDKGMLFPYQRPAPLSFWMKNTVISLDIIFINEDGSIANIARDTTPYSLDSVSSINPAIAVLELRAGLSKELGIEAGDIVRW